MSTENIKSPSEKATFEVSIKQFEEAWSNFLKNPEATRGIQKIFEKTFK